MSSVNSPTRGIKPAATIGIRQSYETPTKGSITTATDTTIIGAPASGSRLVVQYLKGWAPSSNGAANTVTVKWGATAVDEFELAAGEGFVFYFESGNEWVLPAATALVLTTSGTAKIEWSARHLVERAG